jgi:hypothetical protein
VADFTFQWSVGQELYEQCGPHELDPSVAGSEFIYPTSTKLRQNNRGHESEVAVSWFTMSGSQKKRHYGRPSCTIEYKKCVKYGTKGFENGVKLGIPFVPGRPVCLYMFCKVGLN